MSHTLNTYNSVIVYKKGNEKMLIIANDRGITSGATLNYGTLPIEYRPVTNAAKWIILRENITAYLEIKINGEVILSRASSTISSGIWIGVSEVYV